MYVEAQPLADEGFRGMGACSFRYSHSVRNVFPFIFFGELFAFFCSVNGSNWLVNIGKLFFQMFSLIQRIFC